MLEGPEGLLASSSAGGAHDGGCDSCDTETALLDWVPGIWADVTRSVHSADNIGLLSPLPLISLFLCHMSQKKEK